MPVKKSSKPVKGKKILKKDSAKNEFIEEKEFYNAKTEDLSKANEKKSYFLNSKEKEIKNRGDEKKAKSEANEQKHKTGFKLKPNMYRQIAFIFIFLVIIMLGVIFYFSFAKIKITIIPNQEKISNNLMLVVSDKNKASNEKESNIIFGSVEKVTISDNKTIPATGEKVLSEEITGKVTIYNKYSKSQPMVASTRLLSPENKLFRTKETITVPAGGSVEVEVYADKNEADMVIGPAHFTFPALWAGLQDKIYAESTESMKNNKQAKKFITQTDIDNGVNELKAALIAKAQEEINKKYQAYDKIIYKVDDSSVSQIISGKVDEEKNDFTINMQADVAVVAFNSEEAFKFIKEKFSLMVPEGKEITTFDKENIVYSLDGYTLDDGRASINSNFEGKVIIKDETKIIDSNKVAGLTKSQLEEYLKGLNDVAGFEIKFYPSFVKRVPDLLDRIEIKIIR